MSSIPPNTPGIYQITCIPTGKIYIGSAKRIRKRWNQHRAKLRAGKHINAHLQYAWNRYGADAFIFEILEPIMFSEYLLEREQHYIDTLRPYDHAIGFNMTQAAGSSRGYIYTAEIREKLRQSATGRRHSPEARQRMSEARKGEKFTDEHRQRISKANMGRKTSDETRQKISAKAKGRRCSPESYKKGAEKRRGLVQSAETRQKKSKAAQNRSIEYRQHQSEAQRKRDPSTFFPIGEMRRGYKYNEEERRNISEKMRQRMSGPRHIVTLISTGEEMLVHLPSFCVERQLNYDRMIGIIRGNQKTHKGYTVRRATD